MNRRIQAPIYNPIQDIAALTNPMSSAEIVKGANPRAGEKVVEAEGHGKTENDFGAIYKRGSVFPPEGAEEDRDTAREHCERSDFRPSTPCIKKQQMAQPQARQGAVVSHTVNAAARRCFRARRKGKTPIAELACRLSIPARNPNKRTVPSTQFLPLQLS
jgi:hypothetical protein